MSLYPAGRTSAPHLSDIVAVSAGCPDAGSRIAARMHDVSQTGLRIETGRTLKIGSELCVEIDFIGPKRATIAWQRGNLYGCDFATPLRHADAARAMTATPVISLIERPAARNWPALMAFAGLVLTSLSSWWMIPHA